MNSLRVLLAFALLFAACVASPVARHGGYHHYFYRNDLRQHAVNAQALANHAGIGTAGEYGVPGTATGIHGHKSGYHGGYPSHKSGYGYPGYLHHPVYFFGR